MSATLFLRWMLIGELLFYLALSAVLGLKFGWLLRQTAGLALILAVLGRAFIISFTFAYSRIYSSRPPHGCSIGPWRGLTMALREWAAYCLLFTLIMPFERIFMGKDRLRIAARGRLPVLLIHGYQCNRGFWLWIRRRLERAGWQVATLSLNPVFADIDSYVAQVLQRIGEVCSATSAQQVILVGHSMGGLVARACLQHGDSARIARLLTLGSPHHGSRLAVLGMGCNARQMVPGNYWLNALNMPGATPTRHIVSIYSCQDNYVMPQDSPLIPGAMNLPIAGVGHLEMAFSALTVNTLLDELAQSVSAPPDPHHP